MENINYCDKCGNCSRCGECCAATLSITKTEEKKIKEYISKNNIEPEFFQNDESINLQCCFYDRTKKVCKIYKVRPSICRTYKCNKSIEEIEKEKEEAHKKAYWNKLVDGKTSNITDMRLLFYDDPRSLVARIIHYITDGTMQCNKEQFGFVKVFLATHGQGELANCITGEFDDR